MSVSDRRLSWWARTRTREIAIFVAALLIAIMVGLGVRHGVIDPQSISPSGDIAAK